MSILLNYRLDFKENSFGSKPEVSAKTVSIALNSATTEEDIGRLSGLVKELFQKDTETIHTVQKAASRTPPQRVHQHRKTPTRRNCKQRKLSFSRLVFRLVQYFILMWMILGLAMWQHNGYSMDVIPEDSHPKVMLLLAIMTILLSSFGIYLGERGKIAVFTSSFDVVITVLTIFATMFCFADFEDPSTAEALQFISICLNALVVWLSFQANKSLLKMVLVLPSKVISVVMLLLLVFVSAGAASSAVEASNKKEYGKALAMAGTSSAAGAGFVYMKRFVISLTKKS